MATETDIANMALDILKEAPITSFEEKRPIAGWLKRNFAATRDAELEKAEWNFALRRAALPAASDRPAFGWSNAFILPSDCIRLIPLTECGISEGRPIPHEVEDGRILTNAPGPLKIRYVCRNTDYARYPATFQMALAARLAMGMAHWLTGKSNFAQIASNAYQQAKNDAWLSDAVQGTVPRAADNEWVDAR